MKNYVASIDIEMTKAEIKLKKIIEHSLKKNNTKKTIAALETLTTIKYEYNQEYVDEDIENAIGCLVKNKIDDNKCNNQAKAILFYDGFGLDTRGLAYIYLKSLINLGYYVVYVTVAKYPSMQPKIMELLDSNQSCVYNISDIDRVRKLEKIRNVFTAYSYMAALFYSTPSDIVGMVAFRELEGKCNRYLINLTDHAFWAGRDSVDYFIEFRDYGASISHYYRGIDEEKLLLLPYYPVIDKKQEFLGIPKKLEAKKIIFSGGSLYKTIDKDNTFYKLIERILIDNPEVGFIYAGRGPEKNIKLLEKKYPTRVAFINERKDLYQMLKHSYMYLNTYPIGGALMLQYAVEADCIPVSLVRIGDDDARGILRNEEELNEFFYDSNELLKEVSRLVNDIRYKESKKQKLQGMVISSEDFTEKLNQIIITPKSNHRFKNLVMYDTKKFREGYRENFTKQKLAQILIMRNNKILWPYFAKYLLAKMMYSLLNYKKKV